MIKIPQTTIDCIKTWVANIAYLGGGATAKKPEHFDDMFGDDQATLDEFKPYAETIYDFMLRRPADLETFQQVDEAIEALKDVAWWCNDAWVIGSNTILAAMITYVIITLGLYIEANKNTDDIDMLAEKTLIGKYLHANKCFTNQADPTDFYDLPLDFNVDKSEVKESLQESNDIEKDIFEAYTDAFFRYE